MSTDKSTVGKSPPPRSRSRRYVGYVVVLGLLIYGLVDELSTQVRLHHLQVNVILSRRASAKISRQLAAANQTLTATIAARAADQTSLNLLSGELALANGHLTQNQQGLVLQKFDIATLDTCVSGIQRAVKDLQGGGSQAAINSIKTVAGPCQSLQGSSPGGPAYPFDFPDPDVINVSGTYFGYGTNSGGGNIQIIESSDLSHWKTVGDALPNPASWASTGTTWAPGVLRHRRRFLLYYSTVEGSAFGSKQCISVATSRHPSGPFVDSSRTPLICQSALGGSIDPAPYIDESGKPYLTWKSNGAHGQPATIWAEALSPSGITMARRSSPASVLQPSQPWEVGVVEGPFMWFSGGSYYLFYSGNNWNSASYSIGVAVCQGPLGPCTKPLGRPFFVSTSSLAGPGGASVFPDTQGNPWVAFHAWLPGAVGYPNPRLLYVRPLASLGTLPRE
jgi:Glycosyl hydrolases family 43